LPVYTIAKKVGLQLHAVLWCYRKDEGQGIILRQGYSLTFPAGAIEISIEQLDNHATKSEDGYASLTNTLWTWFNFSPSTRPEAVRFILAASRRLDAAHRMVTLVRQGLIYDFPERTTGMELRDKIYETIAAVEMAVVAINRVLQMTEQLRTRLGVQVSLPLNVVQKLPEIKQIRNAYEHIEDRAFGMVYNRPDPEALTVFNFDTLFRNRAVTYGQCSLNIDQECTDLIISAREYIKLAAIELSQP